MERGEAQLVTLGDQATGGHEGWPGPHGGRDIFKIVPIKTVHFGVLFILFCTVNWLDVEGLNIRVGANK